VEDQQEAPGFGLPRRGSNVLNLRLLAVDLDGTLVDRSGKVHPRDREAIERLARRGIPTTILTGRLFSGTRHIAAQIGVEGPIGCVEGCHLVDASSGLDLHHQGLAGNEARVLRNLLAEHRPVSFLFADDRIVYDERGASCLGYVQTWSKVSVETADVLEHGCWKSKRGLTAIVALGAEPTIAGLGSGIGSKLPGLVHVASFPLGLSGLWGTILRATGHSKATALAWVARHHGMDASNVLAVGDWYNDVPMFEVAGRSFAMAQAPDEVKKAATDCLEANMETGGGVLEAAIRSGLL
jgi:hydroxymethylpyrimidine pyrophosphatase-like HAD family hydrolase